jgi:1-deoxy-D-xylulose-5-phosphate reductoisomerase
MTFESMDDHGHPERFPGLRLAWATLKGAPGSCAVLNAANEIAVEAFLNRQIRFDQIHQVNEATLNAVSAVRPQNLADLLDMDRRSREAAKQRVLALG